MAYGAGLRVSEVVNLKVKDINHENLVFNPHIPWWVLIL